ncbi:hypothetical protein GRS96_02520 [Rathayibacter sp. VKM Ac-2803]|uniref:helix-turn-helix transcriptional regulator n=1 Tax=Rathayibacter sp. VKM Ac-2803 TaxID=2609256 RepID=UPI0013567EE4|nr:helix-turn-helix transcriptional regulator [Rathayibacter sp. VKM Ac-2803]MWV48149.1 hypothetical protein [Rathayibacter sp. VKM Ac-2803]
MHPVDQSATAARLRAATSGADWAAVVAMIDRSWVELLQELPDELLAALDQVPSTVLNGRPRLRFAREHLRMLTGQHSPSTYRLITTTADPADDIDRLALLTAQIIAARAAGSGDDVIRLIAIAHDLRRRQSIESTPALAGALPEMLYQWGLALERSGDFEGALLDYVESFDWAATVGHRMIQRAAGGALAYVHALHGRIAMAQTWLDKIPPSTPQDWWEPAYCLQAQLAESLILSAQLRPPPRQDLLESVDAHELIQHWASAFLVRAITCREPHAARRLRNDLDAFLTSLPPGQRHDPVNTAQVDLTRLLLSARACELGHHDLLDRPTTTAHLLRQAPAAVHAMRLARYGKAGLALRIAAPLLDVDGSRPRILVPALLATAIATTDTPRRHDLLTEAALVGHAHQHFDPFAFLPPDLRAEAARLLDALGDTDVAERLRAPEGEGRFLPATLTPRERLVAEHAADGLSSTEIAAALSVSVNTVKTQLRSVYRKLGITSRAELRHLHQADPS